MRKKNDHLHIHIPRNESVPNLKITDVDSLLPSLRISRRGLSPGIDLGRRDSRRRRHAAGDGRVTGAHHLGHWSRRIGLERIRILQASRRRIRSDGLPDRRIVKGFLERKFIIINRHWEVANKCWHGRRENPLTVKLIVDGASTTHAHQSNEPRVRPDFV